MLNEVERLWGGAIVQRPPVAFREVSRLVTEQSTVAGADGAPVATIAERVEHERVPVALAASSIEVALELEHRRKGLRWFPTYTVDFQSRYAWANDGAERATMAFHFSLPDPEAVYDGFTITDANGRAVTAELEHGVAQWTAEVAARSTAEFHVAFRTRGTYSWQYAVADGIRRVANFDLRVAADVHEIDFPVGSLSPTAHERAGSGWRGQWRFESLIANASVGVDMPQRVDPGPLAARMTFFAPVGLLFFMFVVVVTTHARRISIHPVNYLFFGCGFFAFHLLFAYLVDHVEVVPSFALAAATSVGLVGSYARLFLGARVAVRHVVAPQVAYLVLFSCTFFWEGYTGLSITIGAIATLFALMQMTGRVDWAHRIDAEARVVKRSGKPVATVTEPPARP
jgi:hypothetical protein